MEQPNMKKNIMFDLTGKVVVITGGYGLLGQMHARAIKNAGGTAILTDVDSFGIDVLRIWNPETDDDLVFYLRGDGDNTKEEELKKLNDFVDKRSRTVQFSEKTLFLVEILPTVGVFLVKLT